MRSVLARLLVAAGLASLCIDARAATIVWTNTAGGAWKTATNWSPNKVPGGSDTALINLDGSYTVTVSANASVGNLTLGGDTGIAKLSVTAGTFKISTNGVATILGGAELNLAGGILDGDGIWTVAGTMNWTKGEIRPLIRVEPSGRLNVASVNLKYLSSGIFDNFGTMVWSDNGAFQLGAGSSITNRGVFEVRNDLAVSCTNKSVFVNQGTFRKVASPGLTTFTTVEFRNSGTIDLQTGGLALSSGKHSFTDGSHVIGPGSVSVSGAELTLSGIVSTEAPLELTGGSLKGTFNLTGDLNYRTGAIASGATITGILNILGGNVANPMTVIGAVNLASGQLSGLFTLHGHLNWTGGTMASTKAIFNGDIDWSGGVLTGNLLVQPGRTLVVADSALKQINGGVLTNQGTVRLEWAGGIKFDNASVIYNYGSFFLANDTPFTSGTTSPSRFYNYGSLLKAGTGQLKWDALELHNRGTVDVLAGILALGTRAHSLGDNSTITGVGRFQMLSGIVALGTNVSVAPALEILDGTLAASGVLHGNIEWKKGSLTGVLTVPAGRQVRLSGTGTKILAKDSVLNVAGTALVEGNDSLLFFANATINNSGTFEFETDGNFTFNGTDKAWFNNAGILRKTVSTDVLPFGALQLVNTGTVEIQAGEINFTANTHTLGNGSQCLGPGTLRVNGGILNLDGAVTSSLPLHVVLGSLGGNGIFAGAVNVSGGQLLGNITVDGPVTWSAGTLAGTLTAKETMEWSGGTLSGTLVIPAGANLTVKPGGTRLLTGAINNAGRVTVQPLAFITLVSGTPLVNSGVLEVQDDLPFKLSGSSKPIFINSGTFQKTVSSKTLSLSFLLLQNSGTVEVQSGSIDFTLNSHTFASGSRLTGAGLVRIAGASVTMNSLLRVECPLTLASGFLLGDATLAGSLTMAGGQLPGVVLVTNAFTWSGGEVKGTLAASNRVAWSGGTLSGTVNVPAAARFEVLDGSTKIMTGTLNNYGQLSLLDLASIQMDNGCVINNAGLCETWADDPFGHLNNGIPTFNNTGTFRKLGSQPATISLDVAFRNSGVVDVVSNSLSFISGTHTFSSGARFIGGGLIRLAGATVNWNGAVTNTCPMEVVSGLVAASGSIQGTVRWLGGTWKGELAIPAAGELCLIGTGVKTFQAINLTNWGRLILEGSGALQFMDDAIVCNNGLMELQAGNTFTALNNGKKWVRNCGILRKTGSAQPFVFGGVQLTENIGVIDLQDGPMDFTLNSHNLGPGTQVTGPGAIRIAGATVTLAGNCSFSQPLQLNSGILDGTATNSGGLNVAGGQMTGNLAVNGPVLHSAGVLAGTLTANQAMEWSGGTISGTLVIPAGVNLTVTPGGTRLLTGTINNAGRVTVLDSAVITLVNGTPLMNSGLFEVQDETPFKLSGTSKPVFNNSGTFRKTVSSKTLSLSFLLLQNSGTVDVQAGGIDFTLNDHTFANGSRLTGVGPVRIAGASVTMNSLLRVETPFELASGSLSGDAAIAGSLTLSGGLLPGVVVVTNAFIWSGGEVKGSLTVNGLSTWDGGLLSGTLTVPAGARANVLPGGNKSISGVFQNGGFTVVSNNAAITLLGGTPIVNSGVLEVQNDQPFKPNGTTKVNFINSGTFRKTTSTRLMKLDYVQLQNSGTLDLQTGELSLQLNDHSFAEGTRTTGAGIVHVDGATLNVAGTLTLGPALALDSGYLAGNATLNGPFQFNGGEVQDKLKVNGQFDWSGGFLKGGVRVHGAATWTGGELDGWLSIATNSTLVLNGASTKTIKGGTLTNSGFVTVTSPLTIQGDGGAVVQNFGGFNLPVSVTVTTPWGGKPTFNNFGSLSLTNGSGVFTFPGKLLQFPSGQLEIELAGRNAGVDFVQTVNVPELTLDGALAVRTVGGYEPALGDRLEIIKCAARVGTFASYTANTPRLSPDYSTTNVTLFAAAPTFASQPVTQTVGNGANVNFSASAYGSQPMSWQWLRNGAPLDGATNALLTLTHVQPAHEGAYVAVVTNIWGSATSTQAMLKTIIAPSIVRQPVAETVNQGETATFSVEATGNYLSYRWRFETDWLPGAINATLVLSNVTAANAGKYKVEVSNLGGTLVSTEVILTVVVPPTITEQPASQIVGAGSNPSLSVKASGTAPFSYLWLKDGAPVIGATNSSLTLNNVGTNQAGSYVVLVANGAGAATSQPAIITIKTPPSILTQPLSQSVNVGSNVLLAVTATGIPAPTYQWRKNGVTISGATSPTLMLPLVQPRDSGDYTVAVANSEGSLQSAIAHISVVVPELLFTDAFSARGLVYSATGYGHGTNAGATKESGEPSHAGKGRATNSVWISWWAPANGIVTFNTAGSDFDTVLAVYRGAAVNALNKVAADDDSAGFHCSKVSFNAVAGTYYQIAVAGEGASEGNIMLSWDLLITSELLPEITQAPLDTTGNTNDIVTLQVVFSAFEPTAIQWFYQGQTLAGATNATYVIPNLQEDKVGGYAVRLTGFSGRNVVSAPGDIQINTEGASGVSARNKFFDAAESALTP